MSTARADDAGQNVTPPPRTDAVLWALRFVSGKYQGGEFPLRTNREINVGRSSDLDLVLVEDMVSRKHAKFVTGDETISVQDMGSTNGTFVNGEKIRKADLKDGDRILIGTSIIKLVVVQGEGARAAMTELEARSKMQVTAQRRAPPKSMSGNIEEIPLPDLLQLLSTSRKSGVLCVRSDAGVARLFLRKGQIYFASADGNPVLGPRKVFFRALGWAKGFFELEPPDERPVGEEMADSTEALLMEGMRQMDEMKALAGKLPAPEATLSVARPLAPRLRDLRGEEIDVIQVVVSAGAPPTTQALLDQSHAPDLETAQLVISLVERGYLAATV